MFSSITSTADKAPDAPAKVLSTTPARIGDQIQVGTVLQSGLYVFDVYRVVSSEYFKLDLRETNVIVNLDNHTLQIQAGEPFADWRVYEFIFRNGIGGQQDYSNLVDAQWLREDGVIWLKRVATKIREIDTTVLDYHLFLDESAVEQMRLIESRPRIWSIDQIFADEDLSLSLRFKAMLVDRFNSYNVYHRNDFVNYDAPVHFFFVNSAGSVHDFIM